MDSVCTLQKLQKHVDLIVALEEQGVAQLFDWWGKAEQQQKMDGVFFVFL